MATLLQKRDGSFYIRGRANGAFCTWQVTNAGVEFLRTRYGCGNNSKISPDIVQLLVKKGYAFTGGGGLDPDGLSFKGWGTTGAGKQADGQGCLAVLIIILFLIFLLASKCSG